MMRKRLTTEQRAELAIDSIRKDLVRIFGIPLPSLVAQAFDDYATQTRDIWTKGTCFDEPDYDAGKRMYACRALRDFYVERGRRRTSNHWAGDLVSLNGRDAIAFLCSGWVELIRLKEIAAEPL